MDAVSVVRRKFKLLFGLIVGLIFALLVVTIWEVRTSYFQAKYFSHKACQLTYQLEKGKSSAIVFPESGPFDQRMGYVQLPSMIERLKDYGYHIDAQAKVSKAFLHQTANPTLYPIYTPKAQAGLTLTDASGQRISHFAYPQNVYKSYDEIPRIVVATLLFVENRHLLTSPATKHNPVVEWRRLLRASFDIAMATLGSQREIAGGSTLATQLEKFRHSSGGETSSAREKLRQMVSASTRVYLHGEDTSQARRQIILDYVNNVPLGASRGWGEVHGFADGMWVWFGADIDTANAILRQDFRTLDSTQRQEYARVYRQFLSLIAGQQRPGYFFSQSHEALHERVDRYLRLLSRLSVIDGDLAELTLKSDITILSNANGARPEPEVSYTTKYLDTLKAKIARMLDVSHIYELERMDLKVASTINHALQAEVESFLQELRSPDGAKKHQLQGYRLIGRGNPEEVVLGFALYERKEGVNVLRVQADNHPGHLNVHEGTKLDWGSTAKLRAVITYLEVISELYESLNPMDADQRAGVLTSYPDVLTHWAVEYMASNPECTLQEILNAAMQRRYSASPRERFWTGGGSHWFGNANSNHDGLRLSVFDALRVSTNLVFVRMMRDIVNYYIERLPGAPAHMLRDNSDPRREEYLARFARADAEKFIRLFFARYRDMPRDEALGLMMREIRKTPGRVAMAYHIAVPEADAESLGEFLAQQLPRRQFTDEKIEALYNKYTKVSTEGGQIYAREHRHDVNPIEPWVIGFLHDNPGTSLNELMEASEELVKQSREWLLWPQTEESENRNIGYILEEEAFRLIAESWRRLGYPYETLVPSYATALGSSSDRPDALAELVGIILNEGVRQPTIQVSSFHFAQGTPFETLLTYRDTRQDQVMRPEVAKIMQYAMKQVVINGTARGVHRAFVSPDNASWAVGGKTGTGDNRFRVYNREGKIVNTRTVNRTASWVFTLGECYFGTVVAYVDGPQAARYTFNSTLTVRILERLAPILNESLLNNGACTISDAPKNDGP